ncbi:MAG: hypothetical protein AAFV45_05175 [Pseudomonadota bacterium]
MFKTFQLALAAALLVTVPASITLAHSDHKHGDGHKHGAGHNHDKSHAHGEKHDHSGHDHSGHDHAGHGPKHGGQYFETAAHHGVEMVATDKAIVFHLTQDHEPIDVTGTTFKAVVQSAAGTKMLNLVADGSKLETALEAPLPKGAKVVISGKAKSGAAIQARFIKE